MHLYELVRDRLLAHRTYAGTTLAARHYGSQQSVLATLVSTLALVGAEIQRTQGILAVPNPTLPQEDFADAWDVNSYARFVRFVRDFQAELVRLVSSENMENVAEQLAEMFGEQPTNAATAITGSKGGSRTPVRRGCGREHCRQPQGRQTAPLQSGVIPSMGPFRHWDEIRRTGPDQEQPISTIGGPTKCPPIDPVFRPFWSGRPRYASTARSADRAVPVRLYVIFCRDSRPDLIALGAGGRRFESGRPD